MYSRFAFIDFKESQDAATAVQQLDGTDFEGRKLTVQRSCKSSIRVTDHFGVYNI